MKKPTAIDLFAGCGGLTQGLKDAGFNVVGAVEIDVAASESYRLNHPRVHLWQCDIRELEPSVIRRTLKLQRGELGLLAGCPPCQGFSTMRTLNGSRSVEDERNDLIDDYMRLVEGLLPKTVMMENVPGLAADKRLHHALQWLRYLGYAVDNDPSPVRVLNAADYGVPQRRRRMILLTGRFGPITFAVPSSRRISVRDTIGSLPIPGDTGDPVHDAPEHRSQRILTMIEAVPKNGGSRTDLPEKQRLKCHVDCDGFRDVYGRMSWDDVAPTITGGCVNPSKGRFLHPEQHRAVTLREAALLQSFPRHYKFSLKYGKYAAAEQIGNALPPEFIRRQASMAAEYLKRIRGTDE